MGTTRDIATRQAWLARMIGSNPLEEGAHDWPSLPARVTCDTVTWNYFSHYKTTQVCYYIFQRLSLLFWLQTKFKSMIDTCSIYNFATLMRKLHTYILFTIFLSLT
jgi:hypothetical protein